MTYSATLPHGVTRICRFGQCCTVVYPEFRICSTIFPSGRELVAAPQDTPEYRETARRHGYKDPWDLCREHELIHSLAASLAGLDASPSLTAAVYGHPADPDIWDEEELVLRAQGLLHGREVMGPARWRGVTLSDLLWEARRVLV